MPADISGQALFIDLAVVAQVISLCAGLTTDWEDAGRVDQLH
jgi:hypothetical protein